MVSLLGIGLIFGAIMLFSFIAVLGVCGVSIVVELDSTCPGGAFFIPVGTSYRMTLPEHLMTPATHENGWCWTEGGRSVWWT